jgi:hypothetical protein
MRKLCYSKWTKHEMSLEKEAAQGMNVFCCESLGVTRERHKFIIHIWLGKAYIASLSPHQIRIVTTHYITTVVKFLHQAQHQAYYCSTATSATRPRKHQTTSSLSSLLDFDQRLLHPRYVSSSSFQANLKILHFTTGLIHTISHLLTP